MTLTAKQRETLAELEGEIETVLEERRQRDLRLAQLQTAVNALMALDTDEPVSFDGTLTDACRAALRNAGKPLSPVQVRDAVLALGYDPTSQSNLLASIHSVLKRLAESGDVRHMIARTRVTKDGMTELKHEAMYYWTGEAEARRMSAVPYVPGPNAATDAVRQLWDHAIRQRRTHMSTPMGSPAVLLEDAVKADLAANTAPNDPDSAIAKAITIVAESIAGQEKAKKK